MDQTSLPFPAAQSEPIPAVVARPAVPRRPVSALTKPATVPIWLGTILVVGALLRFVGLNWDEDQHLHPDERFLTMVETDLKWPEQSFFTTYLDEKRSTLNPRNVGHGFFVYGDFPIILIKGIAMALNKTGYGEVNLVGRAVDGIVDLGTLLALFLLARRLYRDNRIALLASLLYALTALAIQQSHFFIVDNFSAFFVTLALYFMARVFERDRWQDYALAGASIGLALASKVSIYSIVLVMGLVGAYRLILAVKGPRPAAGFERVAAQLVLSALVAALAFRLFQPYAFQGPGLLDVRPSERWLANLMEARRAVTGDYDAPFAHQWADRASIIFPLQNMVLWGMGLPLGVSVWLGWAVAAWQLLARQRWAHLIPVAWTAVLFALLGTQWVKSLRYFLPIYPTLILLGAWLLVWLWDQARLPRRPMARIGGRWLTWTAGWAAIAPIAVVLGSLLYAVAFTGIYTRPVTRVAASRWIFANIPPGTAIANETPWDDGLPLRVDGKDGFAPGMYRGLNLELTGEDSPKKMEHVLDVLDQAEYLFISSNRQYDSMPRLPMRFPMVVKYYQALFGGQLGFERVAEFTSYPQLFGIQLPDQGAEEAWSVYDHPRVQIFKKTSTFSRASAEATLGGVNWDAIVQLNARQASQYKNGLLLSADEQRIYQGAGTWHELFDVSGLANRLPVLFWALAVLLIGTIAVPYVWLAAAPLPDRGYALSKPLGLLLVAWLVWWLGSLKVMPFSRGGIGLSLMLLGLGSLAIVAVRREAFSQWLRANRRLLLIEEGLFWGFFGLVLFIRWMNPDLWHPVLGGEKPMDLSFLNATVKSVYFPPYDPWFAGGYINYYYFGFVLVATLIKLTGVVPYLAYNLAIPTFFSYLALAAFGATLAFVAGSGRQGPIRRRPLIFALLGALIVAVIGNLRELTLILEGFQSLSRLEFRSTIPGLVPLVKTVHGFITGFLAGKPLDFRHEWWYWNATRVIHHPSSEAGPINEMPWFTFQFADLHAHLMALPYTAVAVGLALAYVRELPASGSSLGSAARLALLGLVIGALWPLNTWDFPTYAFVALTALTLWGWRRYGRISSPMVVGVSWRWGLLVGLGYLFFLPFHRAYGSSVSGLERWTGSQTSLADYLTIHGFFLFLITSALLLDFWLARDLNPVARLLRLGLRWWYRPVRLKRLHERLVAPSQVYALGLYLVAATCLLLIGLVLLRRGVPALIVALMALTVLLFFRRAGRGQPSPSIAVALWQLGLMLFFMGLGLTLVVEFVVLKNVDISRMNTVFKFYLQVWVLWGIAAAAATAWVSQRLPRCGPRWQRIWPRAFAALFAATLLYPILSTTAKISDRFDTSVGPTLDGMAFMDRATLTDHDQQISLIYDKEAMRWMQQALAGSPVIAEVNTHPTLYGWGDRFTVYTGNPDVVGWDWHERQQRAAVPTNWVPRRIEDIQKAYGTTDAQEAYRIFSRYGVQYFVVGQLERAYFPAGQGKWDPQNGKLWDLVYENPGVRIYQLAGPARGPQVGDVMRNCDDMWSARTAADLGANRCDG